MRREGWLLLTSQGMQVDASEQRAAEAAAGQAEASKRAAEAESQVEELSMRAQQAEHTAAEAGRRAEDAEERVTEAAAAAEAHQAEVTAEAERCIEVWQVYASLQLSRATSVLALSVQYCGACLP